MNIAKGIPIKKYTFQKPLNYLISICHFKVAHLEYNELDLCGFNLISIQNKIKK